jgi:hypothetical protein
MLNIFIGLTLLLISSTAFSCWKAEGSFAIVGKQWKIHHKFENHEELIFPADDFILKISFVAKKRMATISYEIKQKKGLELIPISQGKEDIRPGKRIEIFAKGKTGKPDSLMTIMLTDI